MKQTLGQRVRELRQWSGFTVPRLARLAKCSVASVRAIERGQLRPRSTLLVRLADVLDAEVEEFERLVVMGEQPRGCTRGCDHHGEMRPGGLPAGKFDECAYYGDCLAALVRIRPNAKSAHCQPDCSKKLIVPYHVRYGYTVRTNGDGRWDSADPWGTEVSLPSRAAPSVFRCECAACKGGKKEGHQ